MPKVQSYRYEREIFARAFQARGLEPIQVGRDLQISAGTVRAWLRGDNAPRLDIYLRFCSTYGYNPTTLLARDGKR